MLSLSESAYIQLVGFVVTLLGACIAGGVAIQINRLNKRNSSQHAAGTLQRDDQMAVLQKISEKQDNTTADVIIIKGEVLELKTLRLADRDEFLKLYERVLNSEFKQS